MQTKFEGIRVGVYVDAENIRRNGGGKFRYDVLREFACRGGAVPLRMNTYLAYDAEKAKRSPGYRQSQEEFHSLLREYGFKVIIKTVRWYTDDDGGRIGKANADLDLAVDALLQSDNLDRVVLATGDGDFVRVVRALQNKGRRVEILAFENVSRDLRKEADTFTSGYLVPNLIPKPKGAQDSEWGEIGSRVRGFCYSHPEDFGHMRVMKDIDSPVWHTDTRKEESPYISVFFHDSDLKGSRVSSKDLPSRDIIFEFDIVADQKHGKTRAANMTVISPSA